MNLIVAADKNWAIGLKNKLLVSIPEDMKFFRTETTGKVVVVGRKTVETFPGGNAPEESDQHCSDPQSGLSGEGSYCLPFGGGDP